MTPEDRAKLIDETIDRIVDGFNAREVLDAFAEKLTAGTITKDALLQKLDACRTDTDREQAHIDADDALLDYINDPEILEAYQKIEKWYA